MPFRKVEKLANIGGTIAPSAVLTSELPKAGTYMGLLLSCLDGGVDETVAQIIVEMTNIRVSVNGVDIVDASSATLFSLYSYYHGGRNASELAGLLPIRFARDHLPNAQAEVFGLGMRGVNSFTLEVTMGGTVDDVDQIQIRSEKRDIDQPVGQHVRLEKFPRSFASTGVQEVTDIPIEANAGTLAFHIEFDGSGSTATTLTEVIVIANGTEVLKLPETTAQYLAEKAGREWQLDTTANALFSVDFSLFDDLSGFLSHDGLTDLRLQLKWGGAAPDTFTVIREGVFGLGQANG